jgi:hypothetical protein
VAAKWNQTKLKIGFAFISLERIQKGRRSTQYWPYLGGEPVTIGSTVDDPLMIATERRTAYGPAQNKNTGAAQPP